MVKSSSPLPARSPDASRRFSRPATMARALGHPHRLALLEHIGQGERPVERLAELVGVPIANASQHLQLLRRAGLLRSRRNGKQVLYRLDAPVPALLTTLWSACERTGRFASTSGDPGPGRDELSVGELLERREEGPLLLVDVRPVAEYALGHLPGALALPLVDLGAGLARQPAGLPAVVYGRGPYCTLASDAVQRLRGLGRTVWRFPGGVPVWRAAGLRVERSDAGPGSPSD